MLIRARLQRALENDASVDVDVLKSALEDFIPPSYPTEIELQNLVAVLERTSKKLLPQKFRDMDRSEVIRRVRELTALIWD